MCKVFCLFAICALGLLNTKVVSFKIASIRNDCDDVKVEKIDGFSHEAQINPDGTFTGRLKVPFALDDSVLFKTSFSTWEDGKWNKQSFELAGDLCGALNTYVPTMWAKVADTVKVPRDCPIPAGDYRLENFVITTGDIEAPIDIIDKILVQTEYSKDGKLFNCQQLELAP